MRRPHRRFRLATAIAAAAAMFASTSATAVAPAAPATPPPPVAGSAAPRPPAGALPAKKITLITGDQVSVGLGRDGKPMVQSVKPAPRPGAGPGGVPDDRERQEPLRRALGCHGADRRSPAGPGLVRRRIPGRQRLHRRRHEAACGHRAVPDWHLAHGARGAGRRPAGQHGDACARQHPRRRGVDRQEPGRVRSGRPSSPHRPVLRQRRRTPCGAGWPASGSTARCMPTSIRVSRISARRSRGPPGSTAPASQSRCSTAATTPPTRTSPARSPSAGLHRRRRRGRRLRPRHARGVDHRRHGRRVGRQVPGVAPAPG